MTPAPDSGTLDPYAMGFANPGLFLGPRSERRGDLSWVLLLRSQRFSPLWVKQLVPLDRRCSRCSTSSTASDPGRIRERTRSDSAFDIAEPLSCALVAMHRDSARSNRHLCESSVQVARQRSAGYATECGRACHRTRVYRPSAGAGICSLAQTGKWSDGYRPSRLVRMIPAS